MCRKITRALACAAIASWVAACRGGGAGSSDEGQGGGAPPVEAPEPKGWLRLTILHNNDGESCLIHAGSGMEDFGGVARFKALLGRLASKARTSSVADVTAEVLVLSAGDNILPGPMFEAGLKRGMPYFDSIAIGAIGYHAVALGNHDFDFGPDILASFVQGVPGNLPFLSANLDFGREPRLASLVVAGRIARRVVVTLPSGHRIGVIGVTTPTLRSISAPRNVGIGTDVPNAVREEVAALSKAGVGKIVLLSHLQDMAEDVDLVRQIAGVDVVVSGGGGEVLAKPGTLLVPGDAELVRGTYPRMVNDADGRPTPIITTPGEYRYVGKLAVVFNDRGDVVSIDPDGGILRVTGGTQSDAVEPDPAMTRDVVAPLTSAVAGLAKRVVATTEVPLDGRRHNVRGSETNLGDLVADALLWQARRLAENYGVAPPVVSVMNGGGIRNDAIIPAGPLTELDTFAVLPFSNFVAVLPAVPIERLKQVLEHSASQKGQGAFLQVAGITVRYDKSKPALALDAEGHVTSPGEQVRDVVLADGTVLIAGGRIAADAKPVGVATIGFLARGGGGAPFAGLDATNLGSTDQQALAEYVEVGLGGIVGVAKYPAAGLGRLGEVGSKP